MSAILALIPGDVGTGGRVIDTGWADGGAITISPIVGIVGSGGGTPGPVDVTDLPDASSGRLLRSFADIFYFRIWIIPRVLDAQNPLINTPIPFRIWNAFLTPNEILAITPTNGDGLELSVEPTDIFETLEYREVFITITPDAPYQIDATFDFDFEYGGSLFRFLAVLADIMPLMPNSPIIERYEWKTDILPSYDGTDQRIALRTRPRRFFTFDFELINDADRKEIYDIIYKTSDRTIVAPAYQYQARLKQKTVIGDNKLYFNTKRADVRIGEDVVVIAKNGFQYLYNVSTVAEDHVVITTAFSSVIATGAIVATTFGARLPNRSGLSMNTRSGRAQFNLQLVENRDQIAQPENGIVLPTLDGIPKLLRNPLSDAEAGETFDTGIEIIDNETGRPQFFTAWDQKFVEGTRRFLIQTLFDPEEMEYWRTWLDYFRGQQRSFYLPTYREDLFHVKSSEILITQIEVEGTEYATEYANSPSYSALQVETNKGVFEAKVSAAENLGQSTRIYFAEPLTEDIVDLEIYRISYLMLVRLANDSVTLTHYHAHSIVELSIRAAVE